MKREKQEHELMLDAFKEGWLNDVRNFAFKESSDEVLQSHLSEIINDEMNHFNFQLISINDGYSFLVKPISKHGEIIINRLKGTDDA